MVNRPIRPIERVPGRPRLGLAAIVLPVILAALPATAAGPASSSAPHITIAIVNRSTLVSDDEVSRFAAAIQKQVAGDFAPIWGRTARVVFTTASPDPNAWILQVLDDPDSPAAIGYHSVNDNGVPYMKVFARLCQMFAVPLSRVVSHEVLETLGNPQIDEVVLVDNPDGSATANRIEVCDPVLESTYLIDSVAVSDFVTPAYFFRFPAGAYDFLGILTKPLSIAKDGTQIYRHLTQLSDWSGL
jgi:hypothetical protein